MQRKPEMTYRMQVFFSSSEACWPAQPFWFATICMSSLREKESWGRGAWQHITAGFTALFTYTHHRHPPHCPTMSSSPKRPSWPPDLNHCSKKGGGGGCHHIGWMWWNCCYGGFTNRWQRLETLREGCGNEPTSYRGGREGAGLESMLDPI